MMGIKTPSLPLHITLQPARITLSTITQALLSICSLRPPHLLRDQVVGLQLL